MARYNKRDIYYSDDGDFILSSQSDLEETRDDSYRSLVQGIRSVLNHRRREWPGSGTDLGADLTDFVGKPNTKATGEQIKLRVINAITGSGLVAVSDLFVDVIPLSEVQLLVKLRIRTSGGVLEYNSQFSLREDYSSMKKGKS